MPTRSIHYQALLGVQAAIQALCVVGGLDGVTDADPLPSGRVYLRKFPNDRNLTLPCVVVSEVPLAETIEIATNAADDLSYPCFVTILIANNQDLTVSDDELYWRQHIRDAFRNKRPAAVASALSVPLKKTRWEPGLVVEPTSWREANLFLSACCVWVETRENR